jgi:ferredoxin
VQDDNAARLTIDSAKCQGHGRCYTLAPDLYEADDEGYGVVKADIVPADQVRLAERTVGECPERAITLSRLSTVGKEASA